MGGWVTSKYILKKCRPNVRMQMGVVWLRGGVVPAVDFLECLVNEPSGFTKGGHYY